MGRGEFSLYWLRRQQGQQEVQVPLGAWAGDSQEGVIQEGQAEEKGQAESGESWWAITGWEAGWTSMPLQSPSAAGRQESGEGGRREVPGPPGRW